MPDLPEIPLLGDGSMPPLALLARWLGTLVPGTIPRLTRLPPGNGSLPDLLAAAGIASLALARTPMVGAFHWEGCGGGRVAVGAAEAGAPLHHGQLPVTNDEPGVRSADDDSLLGALTAARLADAQALCDAAAPGADWDRLLTHAGAVAPPAGMPSSGGNGTGPAGAWNPLPFARRTLVALPLPSGAAPHGLRDQRGTRHPAQVIDDDGDRALLVMPQLRALEAVTFAPLGEAVAGCHWEVTPTVLDNGRVRAELDALGQLVRLCWDGRFASWAGPAARPLIDGQPLAGPCTVAVLESGPVRARLAVTRTASRGTLHLIYTLHAHEDVLRVTATWDGTGMLALDHPTTHHATPVRYAGEGAAWTEAQAASVVAAPPEPRPGCRWASLGAEGGLLIASTQPTALAAHAGRLVVPVAPRADYALADALRRPDAGSPGRLALHLAAPGRAHNRAASPPVLHLPADGPVPWWIRRPAGWLGELLLVEQDGRDTSGLLRMTGAGEAWRCALDGTPRERLPRTPERDAFMLVSPGGAPALIRWR